MSEKGCENRILLVKSLTLVTNHITMSTLLINTDATNSKLLLELAKKLGAEVLSLKKDQYEDIILGNQMDTIKTNELVSKNEILAQLKSK